MTIPYGTAFVHVHNGRRNHVAADNVLTLCGQQYVATVVAPPATDRPLCKRCNHEMGLS